MLLGELVGPSPGGEGLPGPSGQGSVWALGPPSFQGCHLPAALRSGAQVGEVEQVWVLLQPLPSMHQQPDCLSVSTGSRASARLGVRAPAGQAAPGVSHTPPHSLPLFDSFFFFFYPLSPSSSLFSVSWFATYF